MIIVDKDNSLAMKAVDKIKQDRTPGAVIELTAEEFKALKDGTIVLPHEEQIPAGQKNDVST